MHQVEITQKSEKKNKNTRSLVFSIPKNNILFSHRFGIPGM